jgi:hypothetical protein
MIFSPQRTQGSQGLYPWRSSAVIHSVLAQPDSVVTIIIAESSFIDCSLVVVDSIIIIQTPEFVNKDLYMSNQIITDIKQWNWQTIIDFGNSLDDFNDAQWRFLKGLIIELAVEKNSEPTLTYVGEVHKDFVWGRHGIDIELKSNMSAKMYTKKGQLRPNYSIKLNNSMGTNTRALTAQDVADIIIVPMKDGVFVLDRATVLANHTLLGDGVSVKVSSSQIIAITGPVAQKTQYNTI